jgi:O-antigen/teichoic acid export membrane protein
MIIIPIAMVVTMFSDSIILLVYNKKFLASSLVFAVLIWSEVFIFFGTILDHLIIVINKQKFNLIFTMISAVTNVVLNLILIPHYGIMGAAIATVISYSGTCVLSAFLSTTRPYSLVGWRMIPKPLIASLVMGVYLFYTRNNLVISIIGGVTIFFLIMFLVKGIEQQDIAIIRQCWKQK